MRPFLRIRLVWAAIHAFNHLLVPRNINHTAATDPNPVLRSSINLKTGLTNRVYDLLRVLNDETNLSTNWHGGSTRIVQVTSDVAEPTGQQRSRHNPTANFRVGVFD
jgi:hypothetical protein